MKKIYLLIIAMAICSSNAFAKNVENLFVVKDSQIQDFTPKLEQVLIEPIVKDNALYSTKNNYFIRLYQSDKDINVFLNCDKAELEQYQSKLKSTGFKAYSLTDKDLQSEYSSDFNNFVELNNITFDSVKVKKNKYNPYNKPLPNRVISTMQYSEDNINFVAKRVAMKSKIKRYVEGYEITITNNTGDNIVLKQANSGDFVSLYDIAKKAVLPAGVDFVPIYGLVAGVKTDLEKNRFTRPFPTNYILKNNESVRILGLTRLQVSPIVDFKFEINGKEKDIQLNTYQ